MIAKSIILFLVLILLPQLWIDWQVLRRRAKSRRLFCWLPTIIIVGYTIYLALLPNWVPDNYLLLEVWYLMMGIVVIPQAVFALCSLVGLPWYRKRHARHNPGAFVGVVLGLFAAGSFLYGLYCGFGKLEVRHVTLSCEGLPDAFDGYRIVHVSDAHVGTFQGLGSGCLPVTWIPSMPSVQTCSSLRATCKTSLLMTWCLIWQRFVA